MPETGGVGTGHRNPPEYFLLRLFPLLFHLHHWDYFSLAASTDEHGHQVSFLFIHVFMYLRLLWALLWGFRPLVCLRPGGHAGRECVSPSDPLTCTKVKRLGLRKGVIFKLMSIFLQRLQDGSVSY